MGLSKSIKLVKQGENVGSERKLPVELEFGVTQTRFQSNESVLDFYSKIIRLSSNTKICQPGSELLSIKKPEVVLDSAQVKAVNSNLKELVNEIKIPLLGNCVSEKDPNFAVENKKLLRDFFKATILNFDFYTPDYYEGQSEYQFSSRFENIDAFLKNYYNFDVTEASLSIKTFLACFSLYVSQKMFSEVELKPLLRMITVTNIDAISKKLSDIVDAYNVDLLKQGRPLLEGIPLWFGYKHDKILKADFFQQLNYWISDKDNNIIANNYNREFIDNIKLLPSKLSVSQILLPDTFFTPGSSNSDQTKFYQYEGNKLRKLRLSKTELFMSLPEAAFKLLIDKAFDHRHVDVAVAHPKYEPGKVRPFITTGLWSHITQKIFLKIWKSSLVKEGCPLFTNFRGEDKCDRFVQMSKYCDGEYILIPLDQKNFDQNQPRALIKNIINHMCSRLYDVNQDDGIKDLIKLVNARMINIIDTRQIIYPQENGIPEKGIHKVEGGLLSGDAFTSELGSIISYYEILFVLNSLNLTSAVEQIYTNGDDLWLVLKNKNNSLCRDESEREELLNKLVTEYNRVGLVVHIQKNFVSTKWATFLRTLIGDGVILTYPNRAILSLMAFKPTSKTMDDLGPQNYLDMATDLKTKFQIISNDYSLFNEWVYKLCDHSMILNVRKFGRLWLQNNNPGRYQLRTSCAKVDLDRKVDFSKDIIWKTRSNIQPLNSFSGCPYYFEISKLIDNRITIDSYKRAVYSPVARSYLVDRISKISVQEKLATMEVIYRLSIFDESTSQKVKAEIPIPFSILRMSMENYKPSDTFDYRAFEITCHNANIVYQNGDYKPLPFEFLTIRSYSFLQLCLGLRQVPKFSRYGYSSLVSAVLMDKFNQNLLMIGLQNPWLQSTIARSTFFRTILLTYSRHCSWYLDLKLVKRYDSIAVWT